MPKRTLLILVILIGFGANYSIADAIGKTIAPDNKMLQYTGRIDFSDTASPFLSWPATSIKANFTGNTLAIILDDQRGDNYFNVIVDGNTDYPFVIRCKEGEKTYLISTSLGGGAHSVAIYKRTEGKEGGTIFKGLLLDSDATLLPPSARPSRRIEFYGDSITSGMGNEAADNQSDKLLSEINN